MFLIKLSGPYKSQALVVAIPSCPRYQCAIGAVGQIRQSRLQGPVGVAFLRLESAADCLKEDAFAPRLEPHARKTTIRRRVGASRDPLLEKGLQFGRALADAWRAGAQRTSRQPPPEVLPREGYDRGLGAIAGLRAVHLGASSAA
eukprot:scaffold106020_cov28-Tisochrysis_lutea.AAC.6